MTFLKEKGNKGLIYLLVGVLILLLLIPTSFQETKTDVLENTATDGELEQQLKKVLSAMEGVGDVEVMITTEASENTLFGSETGNGKVCGVVVVAEGAGSAVVNAQISEAVKALFSIDVHKISIVKMKSEEAKR